MRYFKQLVREKSIIFLYLPFLMTLACINFYYGKGPSLLIVNHWNSPVADIFFKYFTHFGDGLVFAIVILVLFMFFKMKWGLMNFVAALFTLIIAAIAKHILFHGMPRPAAYFADMETLHLVEGVKIHTMNSFPSGHTMTAFAVFMTLMLLTKQKFLKVLFVIIAIIAAYSRVYLSQHFLIDVLIGSVLGTFIAILSCTIVDKLSICKSAWTDQNLLKLIKLRRVQQ